MFFVVVDQAVGGGGVGGHDSRLLQFRQNGLGKLLAKLHAPLVEGVDVPDHALREDPVLVEGDQGVCVDVCTAMGYNRFECDL